VLVWTFLAIGVTCETLAARTTIMAVNNDQAPAPTALARYLPDLVRRQNQHTSLCGYVTGNACECAYWTSCTMN
jgi:hypothetical protein